MSRCHGSKISGWQETENVTQKLNSHSFNFIYPIKFIILFRDVTLLLNLIKMQVFDLIWLQSGAVLSGVSLGIKIHPPDPNGRKLLTFDCTNDYWFEK